MATAQAGRVTRRAVQDALHVDSVSVHNGVFTVRRGFFYRHGASEESLVRQVRAAFPQAVVLDSGEVWKPFVGGAPLAKSSHWFVKFTVRQEVARG